MQLFPFISRINPIAKQNKGSMKFQSIRNIRDFRGMVNKDGKQMKEGLFIRSAVLSDITREDVEKLEDVYHLCSIIDLRMEHELKELPDVTIMGADYNHIPLLNERRVGITHEEDSDRELAEAVMAAGQKDTGKNTGNIVNIGDIENFNNLEDAVTTERLESADASETEESSSEITEELLPAEEVESPEDPEAVEKIESPEDPEVIEKIESPEDPEAAEDTSEIAEEIESTEDSDPAEDTSYSEEDSDQTEITENVETPNIQLVSYDRILSDSRKVSSKEIAKQILPMLDLNIDDEEKTDSKTDAEKEERAEAERSEEEREEDSTFDFGLEAKLEAVLEEELKKDEEPHPTSREAKDGEEEPDEPEDDEDVSCEPENDEDVSCEPETDENLTSGQKNTRNAFSELSAQYEELKFIEAEKQSGKGPRLPDMKDLYREMAGSAYTTGQLKKVFEEIFRKFDDGAVLWHCTEGKDRCGIVSALFLYLLDFDWNEILKDYLLTNKSARFRAMKYFGLTWLTTGDRALAGAIRSAYMADESYLKEYWTAIEEKYGSMDDFLRDQLEITDEMKQRLKDYCLETAEN